MTKIILIDQQRRLRAIEAIKDAPEGYVVTILPKKRTLSQNDLFHDLCAQFATETGYTPQEVKDVMKFEVFGLQDREINGHVFQELKSSASLNTKDFGKLIDRLFIRAGELGVTLTN